jgi:hypothetical protein
MKLNATVKEEKPFTFEMTRTEALSLLETLEEPRIWNTIGERNRQTLLRMMDEFAKSSEFNNR